MLKTDFNLDYQDFIKEYVTHPIYDWTISFSYKGRYYQFDFVGVSKNDDGSTAYEFVAYESNWDSESTRVRYKSLMDAINCASIDGKSFKEIYEDEDSELIDAS